MQFFLEILNDTKKSIERITESAIFKNKRNVYKDNKKSN